VEIETEEEERGAMRAIAARTQLLVEHLSSALRLAGFTVPGPVVGAMVWALHNVYDLPSDEETLAVFKVMLDTRRRAGSMADAMERGGVC